MVLWHEIVSFLAIAHMKDKASYPSKMSKFKSDVKKLYAVRAQTFLSTEYVGDEEKCYIHCLGFYMAVFARKSFEDHGPGLGIFTMQGF